MKVYQAINAVMKDLSAEGIAKARKNASQGYQFRGIDDVYNALSSSLSRHGLVMLPRVLSRACEERASAKGGALFYVTVDVEFDLVCAEDDSKHTIRTWGEAMDSADKATNKAMSAAYKYAAMQAFCIPTEGDNDADADTPEPSPAMTPANVSRLHGLMAETDTDEITFVGWLTNNQFTSLEEVPNALFKQAEAALAKKKTKLKEKA